MRKLITHIFLLLTLISLVYITKEIVEFSKDIILFNSSQLRAAIKQDRMLHPVVKVSNIIVDTESKTMDAMSTATGFSIEYDAATNTSLIITNDHFCTNVTSSSALIVENYEKRMADRYESYLESEVIYTDPELDLCLLRAYGFIKPASIANYNYEPLLFEEIYIVGAPSGNFPIIIDTYVSSRIEREDIFSEKMANGDEDFFLVSEQIFPGHSGSPAYNAEGEVIGVVFAAMRTYGGIIISHRDITELLYRANQD